MELQSLTLLANMLAHKYNVDVRAEGTTASCARDPNTGRTIITVPAFIEDSDAQRVYVRGYIDHEIGHARFTTWEDTKGTWITDAHKTINNILEDVYVERMMGQCYPGCAINLRAMQHQLFEVDKEFEKSGADIEPTAANAGDKAYFNIMRYILYKARGINMLDMATDELNALLPGLVQKLEPLMAKIPSCHSTADTVALTKDIYDMVREYLDENKTQENAQQAAQNGQGQGQSQDGQGQGQSQDGQKQDSGDQSGQQSGGATGDSGSNGDGSSLSSVCDTVEDLMSNNCSFTYEISESARSAIANSINNAVNCALNTMDRTTYMNPTQMHTHTGEWHMAEPMAMNMRQDAERCVAALSAQLQALMQAKGLRKRNIGLFGKLDSNKLHRIALNNPRVFMKNTEVKQINTQVVILCDASGSMEYDSKNVLTSKAVYALIKSLRSIHGVKSGAFMFGGRSFDTMASFDMPLFKSRMFLEHCDGNTPGGSALQRALHEFDLTKNDRKIVLMLTDGDFDRGERPVFSAVYREAQDHDIDVIGVGIKTNAVANLWKDGDFFCIDDLGELAPKLFEILRTRLV